VERAEQDAPGASDREPDRRPAPATGSLGGLPRAGAAAPSGSEFEATAEQAGRFAEEGPEGLAETPGAPGAAREASPPQCSDADRAILEKWAAPDAPDRRLARRASAVLASLEGFTDREADALAGLSFSAGDSCRASFAERGPEALVENLGRRSRWADGGPQSRSDEELATLKEWASPEATDRDLARKAAAVIGIAYGLSCAEVAEGCGSKRATVWQWAKRFAKDGPKGLFMRSPPRGLRPRAEPVPVRGGRAWGREKPFGGWTRYFAQGAPETPPDALPGLARMLSSAEEPSAEEDISTLKKWADRDAPDRELARRAVSVIGSLGGLSDAEAAALSGAQVELVEIWTGRFFEYGPDGLLEKSKRPGARG
jgi:transposase